jgi:hypothetical protein
MLSCWWTRFSVHSSSSTRASVLDGVIVVTSDAGTTALARERSSDIVVDEDEAGHRAASVLGVARAVERGAESSRPSPA